MVIIETGGQVLMERIELSLSANWKPSKQTRIKLCFLKGNSDQSNFNIDFITKILREQRGHIILF